MEITVGRNHTGEREGLMRYAITAAMLLVLVLIGLLGSGCMPAGHHEVQRPTLGQMPPGAAQVVVLRVSRAGGDTGGPVTVWDGTNLIGHTTGKSQAFVVYMRPGRHRLAAVSEGNVDVVEAEFAPGYVYYVFIMFTDFLLAKIAHINPLHQNQYV